ncbi:MAG: hypothetical protein ABIL09_12870 [Gemmatimonadota bacterium]
MLALLSRFSFPEALPPALLGILAAGALVAAAAHASPSAAAPEAARPWVLLAWDDSGDFGPGTPGTRTAGWQEALDFCAAHARDLYVKGGYGGRQAIYHVDTTVRVPPAQDFRIDGGVYVINFRGPDPAADAFVIDSAMNCEYHLGIIVYGGTGAGLRVRPERPVPIDGFPVVVETRVQSQGIADPHPFTPGERRGGTGLVFDAGRADISYSTFEFASVLNFATCIAVADSGRVYANQIACDHLHTNAHNSTLAVLGAAARQNQLRFGIGVDQGATGVTGIVLAGGANILDLATRPGGFTPGRQLVLAPAAAANHLRVRTEDSPLDLVTDGAEVATNQLSWTGPPLPIRTVEGPTGQWTYTQRLYPAVVAVAAGEPSRVRLRRGDATVDYGAARDRDLYLSVGDQLQIEGPNPSTLRIVPQKTW